ncbi:MAG: L-serine ammonia-lyase, iron-sulfur-dependent, subunit alpha [Negativicutes bacterium]|nr:L-serine ammonia-lyase, iron-sulfur-dependent, subunit alpha [Negativicutes bacterium]
MHELTQLIYDDMKPALGVTEPGAIAFAAALARSYTHGKIEKIELSLNSGIYKNAFTCGIPNTSEVGNLYAAALGAAVNQPDKGLQLLGEISAADRQTADQLLLEKRVSATVSGISSEIYISATVITANDHCRVIIRDKHTNVCAILVNDQFIQSAAYPNTLLLQPNSGFHPPQNAAFLSDQELPLPQIAVLPTGQDEVLIHRYSLQELLSYIETVKREEIAFLEKAYLMNEQLFLTGLHSERSTFSPQLFHQNKDKIFSEDELATAQLLCNAAIEARVIGLEKPAMSITGSGAHGIIATMPLYAVQKINHYSQDNLLRATALSYLITMYIKEYSGRLSAFCGCGIAAGTGMACAVAWLKGANSEQIEKVICNMACGITGMICDGGNQGCTMKGIVAVDAAFRAVEFALHDVSVAPQHGINGLTPEDTMRNMGLIASPGMIATEKTIIEIMESKIK